MLCKCTLEPLLGKCAVFWYTLLCIDMWMHVVYKCTRINDSWTSVHLNHGIRVPWLWNLCEHFMCLVVKWFLSFVRRSMRKGLEQLIMLWTSHLRCPVSWRDICGSRIKSRWMEMFRLIAKAPQSMPRWLAGFRLPWISMDVQGYPWTSVDIHGYPWVSMDIHGYPGPSWAFKDQSWEF